MKNEIKEIKTEHGDIEISDGTTVYAKKISFTHYVLSSETDLFNICDCLLDTNKKDNTKGGKEFILRSCSKNCYDFYVKFLKHKNKADLRIAQRSFSNGEK